MSPSMVGNVILPSSVFQGEMLKYRLPWLVGIPGEKAQAVCCMIFGGVLDGEVS